MSDPLESYHLSPCRRTSPMQRNPVCALTFVVCADLCNEFGGLQFDIRKSVITADCLLDFLADNAWNPPDAEQCYQWLSRHITNSPPTIMCACAIVSVTIASMTDAPKPLKILGRNLRCLIYGPGNCIYDNLCSAVESDNIQLSLATYISTPVLLTSPTPKQTQNMEAKQYNQYNGTVYQGCTFTTNNTTNNFYGQLPADMDSPFTAPRESAEKDPDKTDLRVKRLFTIDGIEDIERTTEESNRFLNFLSDHNIRSRLIDSSQDNPILKAAVCFCAKWKSLRFIESDISPKAVLRFLTVNCELKCDNIDEKAIRNTLARMIRKGYDQVLFGDVCDYF